jgi:UDP-N-acetylglucosamine acyltransferase
MISNLAYIDPAAKIADGVIIEPFAVVKGNVEIGENTWIGSHAYICDGSRIGKNCKIFPGAVIAQVPQDLKYQGEETLAIIGDGSVVREYATISKGTNDKFQTVVGKNTLLMSYCHIAHDCIIGDYAIIVNSVQIGGHVEIGDYAIVGGTSAIHQFVKIGAHAIIAGGSLVNKDIPPYVKAARHPIAYCGINTVGLKRRGFTLEQIHQIEDAYKLMYQGNMPKARALQIIEEQEATDVRKNIVHFVKNSKRGILVKTLESQEDFE